MKKTICMIICMISLLCVFCGCQKTPEEPIVESKENGISENKLTEKQTKTVVDLSVKRWQTELETKDGTINIHIDAEVVWPEQTEFPVVYVRPHAITENEVQIAVEELFDDEVLYDGSYNSDKQNLERIVLAWRADLESLKTNGRWSELSVAGSAGQPCDPQLLEEEISWVEGNIKQAEKDYEAAPENVPVMTELKFAQFNGYKSLSIRNDEIVPASLGINIRDDSNDSYMEFRDWKGLKYEGFSDLKHTEELSIELSRNDAQKIAESFVAKLGINASVGKIQGNGKAYLFLFSRNIEGVPCKYVQEDSGALGIDGEEYREPWNAERIEVMVNDDGIIGFEWESPPEIIDTVNENVSMKSYEEIIDIAEKLLPMQFAKEVIREREITVKELSLGMMRVAKLGTEYEYYYIPVWDIVGYYGKTEMDEDESLNHRRALLTLNAIDGTVIDRARGY